MIVLPRKNLWTPAKYSGAKVLLHGGVYDSIKRTGGACEEWYSLIGGYTFIQTTGGERPLVDTRDINGVHALEFVRASGSNIYHATFASLFNGTNVPFSVYFVGAYDLLNVTQRPVCMRNTTAVTLNVFGLTSGGLIQTLRRDDASNLLSTTTSSATTSACIYMVNFDGTNANMYRDGVLLASVDCSTGIGVQTFNQRFILGRISSTSDAFDGIMGACLVTDGLESSTVREKNEGYFAHEFALTGSLDSAHPYKTYRP